MASGFPVPIDDLLASVVELLKDRGAAREIGIIVASTPATEQTSYDGWNGGQFGWGITLALDLAVYGRLNEGERGAAEKTVHELAGTFFRAFENDSLESVVIVPRAIKNDAWRDQANEWLSGAGINNQGRVRSDNIASRMHAGLLFRSSNEINLFDALKGRVTFAPLPVFVRETPDPVTSARRLEPDFVIVKNGVFMVVEVDGDTYHRESPAEAHARLQQLVLEGVHVERVRAEECSSPETAKVCVQKLLSVLDKLAHRR